MEAQGAGKPVDGQRGAGGAASTLVAGCTRAGQTAGWACAASGPLRSVAFRAGRPHGAALACMPLIALPWPPSGPLEHPGTTLCATCVSPSSPTPSEPALTREESTSSRTCFSECVLDCACLSALRCSFSNALAAALAAAAAAFASRCPSFCCSCGQRESGEAGAARPWRMQCGQLSACHRAPAIRWHPFQRRKHRHGGPDCCDSEPKPQPQEHIAAVP